MIDDHHSVIYFMMLWDWSTLGWLLKYPKVHEKWEEQLQADSLYLFQRSPEPYWETQGAQSEQSVLERKDLLDSASSPLQRALAAWLLTLWVQLCSFCLWCWRCSHVLARELSPLSSSYINQIMSKSVPNVNAPSLCRYCYDSTFVFVLFLGYFCFWTTAAAPRFLPLLLPLHEVCGQRRPLKGLLCLCSCSVEGFSMAFKVRVLTHRSPGPSSNLCRYYSPNPQSASTPAFDTQWFTYTECPLRINYEEPWLLRVI